MRDIEPPVARPLTPADERAAVALVAATLHATPYEARTLELLRSAARGDHEVRGVVVEEASRVVVLVLYGPTTGASGSWQLHALVRPPLVDQRGEAGRRAVAAVVEDARRERARLLVAELPADSIIGASLTLLRSTGFRQVGRVPDFFRDGVALLLLERDL